MLLDLFEVKRVTWSFLQCSNGLRNGLLHVHIKDVQQTDGRRPTLRIVR